MPSDRHSLVLGTKCCWETDDLKGFWDQRNIAEYLLVPFRLR